MNIWLHKQVMTKLAGQWRQAAAGDQELGCIFQATDGKGPHWCGPFAAIDGEHAMGR
jgi:hypothetical protein